MKVTTKIFFVSICLLAHFPEIAHSTISTRKFTYESEGWIIDYEFSEYRAEPEETITFTISIYSKIDNYDFRVWIESPYLTIEEKYDESNLYLDALSQGETLEDVLEISVPERAEYGDVYNVIVKTESHNNRRSIGNIRPPPILDPPEYVFSSENMPNYNFNVYVQRYPIIEIRKGLIILQKDRVNKFSINIINNGNGDAKNIEYELLTPDSFNIENSIKGNIAIIEGNSEYELIFNIKPIESGTHDAIFNVCASNHEIIEENIKFEVQDFTFIIYIAIAIIAIILLIIIYKAINAYRNRSSNNYW